MHQCWIDVVQGEEVGGVRYICHQKVLHVNHVMTLMQSKRLIYKPSQSLHQLKRYMHYLKEVDACTQLVV